MLHSVPAEVCHERLASVFHPSVLSGPLLALFSRQRQGPLLSAFEYAGIFSDSDDEGLEVTESGGTGECIVFRETPVQALATVSPVLLAGVATVEPPPLPLSGGASSDRPLIGSTFSRSRSSRLAARRKSQAELWSIDHVNASDKWIAQQVRCFGSPAVFSRRICCT